jgi:hypothetical protein
MTHIYVQEKNAEPMYRTIYSTRQHHLFENAGKLWVFLRTSNGFGQLILAVLTRCEMLHQISCIFQHDGVLQELHIAHFG